MDHPTSPPLLRVAGLHKAFGDHQVLRGIDLTVDAGELVAVLGANGCGKSTVLRCVMGLTPADSGTISVRGRRLDQLAGSELVSARRDMAMVFQKIHLVPRRSALDNVCAGALGRLTGVRSLVPSLWPQEVREEAMACLDRVGLADRAHERAGRLSGGQQQRVAVARALCQRASVVLADEPVAALDPQAAEQVMDLLARLAHEERIAVAAVLHQPDLAHRHADRTVGLSDGAVALDRPAGEVTGAELDELYAADRRLEVAA